MTVAAAQARPAPPDGQAPVNYSGGKKILVDISEQHMYVYDGEQLVYSFVASTGMNNATRTGTFSVLDKIPNAYGATWNIWMPNWLGIYWAGSLENGIHALPILPLTVACNPDRLNDCYERRASKRTSSEPPPAPQRFRTRLERRASVESFDRHRQAAISLLTDASVQRAFDVESVDPQTLDRYGRNAFGWSLLMARQLVEAGVTLVQVNLGNNETWDTHENNFPLLRDCLLPPTDRGVSALIDDLDARGLLDETLIVMCGEMGRTSQRGRCIDRSGPSQSPRNRAVRHSAMLQPLASAVSAGTAALPRVDVESSRGAGGRTECVHHGGESLGWKARFPRRGCFMQVAASED